MVCRDSRLGWRDVPLAAALREPGFGVDVRSWPAAPTPPAPAGRLDASTFGPTAAALGGATAALATVESGRLPTT
ncbi:hypothetical protein [Micromonospora thermarum]|uniref:Uncharacterized protein n=1 Tax=Micromonospora thermarum TaxID=2720024 RepID=A0ABX0Z9Z4_9ACTN|nr:hypothetical protein [Micromonospora thermarum]NJP33933.1 hypothetical protein [Micromonospora thermarum]